MSKKCLGTGTRSGATRMTLFVEDGQKGSEEAPLNDMISANIAKGGNTTQLGHKSGLSENAPEENSGEACRACAI